MKSRATFRVFLVLWGLLAGTLGLAQSGGVKTGYAPVNGLRMYYEIHSYEEHGGGIPLVVLHGGIGSTDMFGEIMPALSARRRVIAVDLRAHGRTGDIDRPLSYEAMADDIAGLIKHLGIEKADVLGYSVGGGVALRTAVQHPNLVRKLVVVSATFKRDGWYPEILTGMALGPTAAEQMKSTPLYQTYVRVAPNPQDWTLLFTKLSDMLKKDYDWSTEIAGIKAPTLLVFGDADAVRTAPAVEFLELLGGGKKDAGWDGSGMSNARLAILPGVSHYSIMTQPALATVATQFLDAPMCGTN
jgi:pimeloyl-ACP methyl ester carboxylesterase